MKLLILDIDGVMTDGRKMYGTDGRVMGKQFNDKDFTAIKRFIAIGIRVCFLSGDIWNKTIADTRNIPFYSGRGAGGKMSKIDIIHTILGDYSVLPQDAAYVGDDIFDIEVFNVVGKSYCPADSPFHVRISASHTIDCKGGEGVIAKLYDMLCTAGSIANADIDHVKLIDEKETTSKQMS